MTLEQAVPVSGRPPTAFGVEQCTCPREYTGLSCQVRQSTAEVPVHLVLVRSISFNVLKNLLRYCTFLCLLLITYDPWIKKVSSDIAMWSYVIIIQWLAPQLNNKTALLRNQFGH